MKTLIFAIVIMLTGSAFAYDSLMDAAKRGDIEEVERLINKGVYINARDCNGWTPLILAAYRGHVAVAAMLLDRGADVNARDKWNYTVLMLAVSGGNVDMIAFLLERGADLNACHTYGGTALMSAVAEGHSNIVTMFLDRGVDVNARNIHGLTALNIAARRGRGANIVRILLPHTTFEDRAEAIEAARRGGHSELADEMEVWHTEWTRATHHTFAPETHRAVRTLLQVTRRIQPHIPRDVARMIAGYVAAPGEPAAAALPDISPSALSRFVSTLFLFSAFSNGMYGGSKG